MIRFFHGLAITGMLIIVFIAFTIPKNPYEIIPALTVISFDKPLWFCIIFGGGFAYLITLYGIYEKLDQKKSSLFE